MGLFGLFNGSKRSIVAIIDVGSASVGAAYAEIVPNDTPVIHYSTRHSITPGHGEDITAAMERTVADVCGRMITEGAPALARSFGRAHISEVMVSVAAPWQETAVSVKTIEPGQRFTFTHAMLRDAVAEHSHPHEGRQLTDTSVIATLLNGYETHNPFGKQVERADLVILSATIDAAVAERIMTIARRTFHTHHATLRAFLPASYAVMRDIYPHEKDYFILDVSGEATDIALIKDGLLADVHTFPQGTNAITYAAHAAGIHATKDAGTATLLHTGISLIDEKRNAAFSAEIDAAREHWVAGLAQTLKDFSVHHALARTIFILADESPRDFLRTLLDAPTLRELWLSDEPLRIVSVQPSHFAHFVRTGGEAQGDLFMAILALYALKMTTDAFSGKIH